MDTPEIDQSLRKHRLLRGTPSNRFSTFLSLGILGVASLGAVIWHFSKIGQNTLSKLKNSSDLMKTSEAQLQLQETMRRQLDEGIVTRLRSTAEIKERLAASEKNYPSPDSPL